MSIGIDDLNKMIDKAKTKKDGIFSSNGTKYLVHKNRVLAFVGNDATVYGLFGGFGCALSEKFRYGWDADKWLKDNKQKIIGGRSSY